MLKNKLEALLFSSGRKMDLEELSRLSKSSIDAIQKALEELKKEYNEKESSTMLVNEGNFWKLTVREQFLSLVRNIVTETELSKTIMETLAVIAFKYPIKQSDLIKLRTNKAYDHLTQLEEMGYITRQKHGRTNLIKLTQKFFEYFDLPEEKLKEQFQDFQSIASAIEQKENEVESIKSEQRRRAMEEAQEEDKIKDQIESLDDSDGEKLGDLDVVDEPSDEKLDDERTRINEIEDQVEKSAEEELEKVEIEKENKSETKSNETKKEKSEGIKTTPEMEKIIDKKVENMLRPKKEEAEEEKPKRHKEKTQSKEEPKDLLEASTEEKEKKDDEKMIFLLQCPNCKNKMKYQNTGLLSEKKRKRCVYCGKSFTARSRVVKKL